MIRYLKQWYWHRRFNKLVEASRNSPACREYKKRREAAKLGHLRRSIRQELARL